MENSLSNTLQRLINELNRQQRILEVNFRENLQNEEQNNQNFEIPILADNFQLNNLNHQQNEENQEQNQEINLPNPNLNQIQNNLDIDLEIGGNNQILLNQENNFPRIVNENVEEEVWVKYLKYLFLDLFL